VEVCAKFGGDWFGGLRVKEGHRYLQTVCFIYIDRDRLWRVCISVCLYGCLNQSDLSRGSGGVAI